MKITLVIFAVIALYTAGCMSYRAGTKIEADKIAQIKKGRTTRAEIEALLGPPMSVGMMGGGRRLLVYRYTEVSRRVKGSSFIPYAGAFVGGATGESRYQTLQIMVRNGD
jgi:outer membrane protein assembly factor BamE (lipoprotein component of BamABCDE complex)